MINADKSWSEKSRQCSALVHTDKNYNMRYQGY